MRNAALETKGPIFYRSTKKHLTRTPHFHNEIELIYSPHGSFDAHVDHKVVTVSPGELFIAFPHQIHYYKKCAEADYRVMLVTPELLYRLETPLRGLRPVCNVLDLKDREALRAFIDGVFSAAGENQNTAAAGYYHLLMAELLPLIETEPTPWTENSTLLQVMEFCQDHFCEDLTLERVAKEVHLSKYYVSHLFNQRLKLSFSEYINLLRVRQASWLLQNSDKKIADISEEVGFGSIRSFNRAFLTVTETTPKEFRTVFRTN